MGAIEVLRTLRGDPDARPAAHPQLVAAARALLTRAAAGSAALADGVSVRVTKAAVGSVLRCEARHVAELASGAVEARAPLVRGRLLDALFRQVATTGRVGPDPLADAVTACTVDGGDPLTELSALDPADRAVVEEEVRLGGRRLAATWPDLPPGTSVRTQERVLVPLAGGRVVLAGQLDLALGRPSVDAGGVARAGVAVVEAKSGRAHPRHLEDLRFYALLEALRWGVPPFRAVAWSLADGQVRATDVDDDLLWSESLRAADAVGRLTRLALGAPARASPGPLCPSCPLVATCPAGQQLIQHHLQHHPQHHLQHHLEVHGAA